VTAVAGPATELLRLHRWLQHHHPVRVLITASRTWPSVQVMRQALEMLPTGAVLVTGGARGGDALAAQIWRWLDAGRLEEHPVSHEQWRFSRGAGMVRNQLMVDLGADCCLAFIRNGSAGASHCSTVAELAGIETFRFKITSGG
jgi:hypothetical protein